MTTLAIANKGIGKVSAGLAIAVGLMSAGNGLAMLASPQKWFWSVPGVSLTGGYNAHFVRDIGIVFLLSGTAMIVGLVRAHQRTLLWTITASWLGSHAVFHLWEVAAGICGPEALPRDFFGVTLPGAISVLLAFQSGRKSV